MVPTILEMEQLQLFNKLEQPCHVNRRPFNQLIFITHVKLVELRATPTIVQHGVIYPKGTYLMISIYGVGERSQIPHHNLVLGGNQGAGIVTYSYCHQMGHLFNCCPFDDDRLWQLFKEEVVTTHQFVPQPLQ